MDAIEVRSLESSTQKPWRFQITLEITPDDLMQSHFDELLVEVVRTTISGISGSDRFKKRVPAIGPNEIEAIELLKKLILTLGSMPLKG